LKSSGRSTFSGDSLPFSFVDDKSQPAGYSIDLCKRAIAQLGRAAGVPDLKVNWLVGTVAERLAMVASGKADLECANTTATQTRMTSVDFSSLVFLDGGGLIVKAATVKQFPDLAARTSASSRARRPGALESVLKPPRQCNVVKVKDGNGESRCWSRARSMPSRATRSSCSDSRCGPRISTGHAADDLSIERWHSRCRAAIRRTGRSQSRLTRCMSAARSIFNQWLGTLGRPGGLLAAMFLPSTIRISRTERQGRRAGAGRGALLSLPSSWFLSFQRIPC
jgi:hypothetical protein